MGFRFRRSFKIGGARFNVGKSGVSTSFGGRGSSVTFGKNGAYSNYGIPGTGISYRSKIGGGNSYPHATSRVNPASGSTNQYQTVPVSFNLDDETGETHWTDANGQPLSENLVAVARKQGREQILAMLEKVCKKFNDKVDLLLKINLDTPYPDTKILYTPVPFTASAPVPPDESQFISKKPNSPTLKKHNFFTEQIGFLGKRLEESNKKLDDEYNQRLVEAKRIQQEMDRKLSQSRQKYAEDLTRLQSDKEAFEKEQARLKNYIDVERLTNVEAMRDFLEEHLDAVEWPLETNASFEVYNGGTQVWLDVDLPEIEMMPHRTAKVNHNKLNLTISELSKTQQQQNYMTHIHAIGFRLIGETFIALPSAQEVILSGYSQRPSKKTGHIEDEYLYSVRVYRNLWEKINFARLDLLNPVACFEMFDMRRTINKAGIIDPIEPFQVEAAVK
jgi:hypothetical protein